MLESNQLHKCRFKKDSANVDLLSEEIEYLDEEDDDEEDLDEEDIAALDDLDAVLDDVEESKIEE